MSEQAAEALRPAPTSLEGYFVSLTQKGAKFIDSDNRPARLASTIIQDKANSLREMVASDPKGTEIGVYGYVDLVKKGVVFTEEPTIGDESTVTFAANLDWNRFYPVIGIHTHKHTEPFSTHDLKRLTADLNQSLVREPITLAELVASSDGDYLLLRTNKTVFEDIHHAVARFDKIKAKVIGEATKMANRDLAVRDERTSTDDETRRRLFRELRQEYVNHICLRVTLLAANNFKLAAYYSSGNGVFVIIDKQFVDKHEQLTNERVRDILG